MKFSGQTLSAIKSPTAELWRGSFGRMHYRNNLLIDENILYFGTSGDTWNRPDSNDAVWAVESHSGKFIWKLNLKGDCNKICLIGDYILCGTDGGQVIAVRKHDGVPTAQIAIPGPLIAGPVVSKLYGKDVGLFLTKSGVIFTFDPVTAIFSMLNSIDAKGSVCSLISDESVIYIGTDCGEVFSLDLETMNFELILEIPSKQKEHYLLITQSVSNFSQTKNLLFVSYTRETYDEAPPLLCIEKSSRAVKWFAQGDGKTTFGNARVCPVIIGNFVYSTFAYNEFLSAFSIDDGCLVSSVRLDDGPFQNWASPVSENGMIYVPRINGVIMKVDPLDMSIHWASTVDEITSGSWSPEARLETWPNSKNSRHGPNPSEELLMGIASTPLAARGLLFIGTISGDVVCMRA
jgi:outer membrane protein assembly factor BamB